MRAWKAGRITHARGFLFTAARNIAIDLIRRGQRREEVPEGTMLALEDERPAVQDQLDQSERLDALVEAVDTLPPRCREVMILRYLEGLSYREIANHLNLSPETVKVHLVKGVRDCIRHFHQRGILGERKVMPITS
jgi:RNA polymerase sigma-70 factor (ECF subfamily)